jgi:hypothetical protein
MARGRPPCAGSSAGHTARTPAGHAVAGSAEGQGEKNQSTSAPAETNQATNPTAVMGSTYRRLTQHMGSRGTCILPEKRCQQDPQGMWRASSRLLI